MKYDMCGAAAVLGITKIIAELNLPLYFIGVLACAENTPGGNAARPDDIVNTHEGISVEILNTDAEGRLVLCDTLSYIKKYNPQEIIDVATLTGACVVALGREYSGLFSNDDELAKNLMDAGTYTNDKCWQMPINKEYSKQLKSNFADIANIGGEAGSITAACFLYQFVKEFKWAHLDVAGTAGIFTGSNKQSTGRPVPLLIKYLMDKCDNRK
jgi:leucyl aminopeptidase